MCLVCGCGQETVHGSEGGRTRDKAQNHEHHPHCHPSQANVHNHDHRHDHANRDQDSPIERYILNYGRTLGGVHVPEMTEERIIQVEQDILSENDRFASDNRQRLAARGVLALNLVSSPGSGKTTLLVRTIKDLLRRFPLVVIEGDQQTSFDADRIRATGVPAVQINTGKGCHLDAHMVGKAIDRLNPDAAAVLLIENVGNLVCPAAFDLGETHKVVMLSVTEGDDKPLKYPDIFHAADLILIAKIDLLPYVSFDVGRCFGFARRVNPTIEIIQLSSITGQGLSTWYTWIDRRRARSLVSSVPARVGS